MTTITGATIDLSDDIRLVPSQHPAQDPYLVSGELYIGVEGGSLASRAATARVIAAAFIALAEAYEPPAAIYGHLGAGDPRD